MVPSARRRRSRAHGTVRARPPAHNAPLESRRRGSRVTFDVAWTRPRFRKATKSRFRKVFRKGCGREGCGERAGDHCAAVKLWSAGQTWPAVWLYLALEAVHPHCVLQHRVSPASARLILQVPECCASVLARQEGQEIIVTLLVCCCNLFVFHIYC